MYTAFLRRDKAWIYTVIKAGKKDAHRVVDEDCVRVLQGLFSACQHQELRADPNQLLNGHIGHFCSGCKQKVHLLMLPSTATHVPSIVGLVSTHLNTLYGFYCPSFRTIITHVYTCICINELRLFPTLYTQLLFAKNKKIAFRQILNPISPPLCYNTLSTDYLFFQLCRDARQYTASSATRSGLFISKTNWKLFKEKTLSIKTSSPSYLNYFSSVSLYPKM